MTFMKVQDVLNHGLHQFLKEAQDAIADLGTYMYSHFMYHPPVDLEAEIRFHQQQEQQQQERAHNL
jgi:hypothetical protein